MTKTEKIIYGFVAICLIATILFLSSCTNRADAGKVGDLAERINELQDKKEECFNKLTYAESKKSLEGTDRYCYEYDEEILKLRAEFDELTYHSYMGLK